MAVLTDRIVQTMLHVGLSLFHRYRAVHKVAGLLCDILLRGAAVVPPGDDELDRVRPPGIGILTFAVGTHFCLGAALARLQGRVALEEVLKRFPESSVDANGAVLQATSITRGYETLPVFG